MLIKFDKASDKQELETGAKITPRFGDDGLITAIVTDHVTGELLMVAHMDEAALAKTLETGKAWYWSRSRQKLWLKGETSGAVQDVVEARIDCDQDAIWLKVDRKIPEKTCHTGRNSCFYRRVVTKNGEFCLEIAE
ncbi:MAG: phosphoribosyl-AMP cyclohydrolase [Rhizobiaceae bacterium]